MLSTANIELRKLELSDIDQLTKLANNKKIADNLRDVFPHPYTLEHGKAFIRLNQQEGFEYNFAIIFKNEFIGMIGAFRQNDVHRMSAEIGYWIGEPYWGKGITSACINLIVNHIFKTTDIIRIFAQVFEYNIASSKVLEKCGFTFEGIIRKAIIKNDKIWDEHLYAILA